MFMKRTFVVLSVLCLFACPPAPAPDGGAGGGQATGGGGGVGMTGGGTSMMTGGGTGTEPTLEFADGGACSVDGFCWVEPTPQGNSLTSIWGSAANDIWSVGEGGALIHFDGTKWRRALVNVSADLQSISGLARDDVWAVGGGKVLHFNGSTWAVTDAIEPSATRVVFAISANDVWSFGGINDNGTVTSSAMHFDGTAWSRVAMTGETIFHSAWASGSNDVYAVGGFRGGRSQVFHFDGTSWSQVTFAPLSLTNALWAKIWGSGPNDVYVAGFAGATRLVHFDGTTWSDVPADFAFNAGFGATWTPANRTWWVADGQGRLWRGAAGTFTQFTGTIPGTRGIWGATDDDIWAVGLGGRINHFDGTRWVPQFAGVSNASISSFAPLGSELFVGNERGEVWRRDGGSWSQVDAGSDVNLLVAAGSEVFARSQTLGPVRWNGETFVPLDGGSELSFIGSSTRAGSENAAWMFEEGFGRLLSVNADGVSARCSGLNGTIVGGSVVAGQLWAASSCANSLGGAVVRVAGNLVIADSLPVNGITATWAFSPTDVWAGGRHGFGIDQEGDLFHFDGTSWTRANVTLPGDVRAFWGTPNDLWAGGDSLAHFDGTTWTVTSPLKTINSMWGSAPNDIWAASNDGMLHFDGTQWSNVAAVTQTLVMAVAGRAANDVWAVGWNGLVLHFNGTTWTSQTLGAGDDVLNGLWLSGTNELYAFGSAQWHFDGTTWSRTMTYVHAFSTIPTPSGVWIGSFNNVSFFDGGVTEEVTSSLAPRALWSDGAQRVWTVTSDDRSSWVAKHDGTHATVRRYDGAWSAIGGSSSANLWLFGRDGVARYDGSAAVQRVDAGVSEPLTSPFFVGANDGWAVGTGGALLHFDGTSWSTQQSGSRSLTTVWASPTDVWLGTTYGGLLHKTR